MQIENKNKKKEFNEDNSKQEMVQSLGQLKEQIRAASGRQAVFADPFAFAKGVSGLESPLWIPGMQKAVLLFQQVLAQKGRIRIIGDRDVDGVSSTSMLGNFLQTVYQEQSELFELIVSDDGDDYGLSGSVLEKTINSNPELVILLDMGSSHGPEIHSLVEQGIQVIVLDHHQLHDRLPDPEKCAFVNPMRLPESERQLLLHQAKIATAGLVFKFLLGYALSHTREWHTLYKIKNHDETNRYYHCGKLVASNVAAPEACKKALDLESYHNKKISYEQACESLQIVELDSESPQPMFSAEQIKYYQSHPEQTGPLLLEHAILTRPKLKDFVYRFSELAAIGLISDMVPMAGENRAMVRIGLGRTRSIAAFQNPGLQALVKKMGVAPGAMASKDVGWSLGPVINAAGRMGQTHKALQVLTAINPEQASKYANVLVSLNQERKQRTADNEAIVNKHFKEFPQKLQQPVIFCYHPDLQKGVSGIVAARLTEQYQKPAIYLHRENDKYAKGSARTWGGVHVLELIDTCAELFLQFGGHPEAAGFSIELQDISELEQRLLDFSRAGMPLIQNETESDTTLEIAGHLIGPDLISLLDELEPFGAYNPEIEFLLKNVQIENLTSLSNGIHAKFKCKGVSRSVDFVIWRKAAELRRMLDQSDTLELTGFLERNYYAGRTSLQFRVHTFKSFEG